MPAPASYFAVLHMGMCIFQTNIAYRLSCRFYSYFSVRVVTCLVVSERVVSCETLSIVFVQLIEVVFYLSRNLLVT